MTIQLSINELHTTYAGVVKSSLMASKSEQILLTLQALQEDERGTRTYNPCHFKERAW